MDTEQVTIKIKYLNKEITPLTYIEGKSDWIDLRSAKEMDLKKGDFVLVPLGIAMESLTNLTVGTRISGIHRFWQQEIRTLLLTIVSFSFES